MQLIKAKEIAEKYVAMLASYCEKISIAGSIRREKEEVNDIEIVCVPKIERSSRIDLFGNSETGAYRPVKEFMELVDSLEKIKGQADQKYTRRKLPEGIELDLFMPNIDNWGYILLIRTGDWEYSKSIVTQLKKRGYTCEGGYIWQGKKQLVTKDEQTVFDLCALPFIQPKQRTIKQKEYEYQRT